MLLINWLQQMAWLILNLSILAVAKLKWPDSFIGKTVATFA